MPGYRSTRRPSCSLRSMASRRRSTSNCVTWTRLCLAAGATEVRVAADAEESERSGRPAAPCRPRWPGVGRPSWARTSRYRAARYRRCCRRFAHRREVQSADPGVRAYQRRQPAPGHPVRPARRGGSLERVNQAAGGDLRSRGRPWRHAHRRARHRRPEERVHGQGAGPGRARADAARQGRLRPVGNTQSRQGIRDEVSCTRLSGGWCI